MNLADRVKETTTSTSADVITLGGAASTFRSFASAFSVGDTKISVSVDDGKGNWENGAYTLTNTATLTRTAIYASSNGGAPTVFPSGSKDVFCTLSSEALAALMIGVRSEIVALEAELRADLGGNTGGGGESNVRDIAFSTVVPLTVAGHAYMPPTPVAANMNFTPAANAVRDALVYLRLIGNGTNAPTFGGAFKEFGSSSGYDPRNGIVNIVQMFYDGYDYWYSIGQAASPSAVDTTAPVVNTQSVENAAPTVVVLTASEQLAAGFVPAASAFTVGGHTVSSVALSGNLINLTVTPAFTNGEAARTVGYTQPATNGARDAAGNLMATFSGKSIANNVGAAATVPAQMTGVTATPAAGSASVNGTPGSNGGSAITGYTASATPAAGGTAITATNSTLPVVLTGLTDGVVYNVTLRANNAIGPGPVSGVIQVTPASQVVYDTFKNLAAVDASAATPPVYSTRSGVGVGSNYNYNAGARWAKHFVANTDGSMLFTVAAGGAFDMVLFPSDGDQAVNNASGMFGIEPRYGLGQSYNVNLSNVGVGTVGPVNGSPKFAVNDIIKIERVNSTGAANTATLIASVYKSGAWTEIVRVTNFPTTELYARWCVMEGAAVTALQSTGLVA